MLFKIKINVMEDFPKNEKKNNATFIIDYAWRKYCNAFTKNTSQYRSLGFRMPFKILKNNNVKKLLTN